MITRRRFLLTVPAAAAFPQLAMEPVAAEAQWPTESFSTHFHKKPPTPLSPALVYFGTDTAKGVSKGIYVSHFDAMSGQLSEPMLAASALRPGFLALSSVSAGRSRLYATNEGTGAGATVSSYQVDLRSGALEPINQVSAGASGPCYVSLDATGEAAFVADYAGSAIATYKVLPDGALSEPVERIDYKNTKFGRRGPVTARQEAPHPHSVHLSPDNRFLLVSDLGSDAISVYAIEPGARLGEP
ncbi:MAG TPA: beta-propeller fold lactonase family protein, partial [Acidobacteriaceae bacterium]|nr:beta-propeller fold lactonase family protein [Acidobacteriaceae bacterium]